jgi:hypothetical protein
MHGLSTMFSNKLVFDRPIVGCCLQDGKSIISGWSDGKIRAFAPQSGKLLYTIHDAHHKAVTAIASTSDSSKVGEDLQPKDAQSRDSCHGVGSMHVCMPATAN